jgi:hypothetical protein
MTWIISTFVAHHAIEAFKSCYRKAINIICTAVARLVVGLFRAIFSTVTWLARLVLGLVIPSHSDYDYDYDYDYDHEDEVEVEFEYEYEYDALHLGYDLIPKSLVAS